MPNKYYIPTPIFNTLEEVMAQHKKIYADENPLQIISQWFHCCFSSTKVTVPLFAPKDYQMALDFLYSYRGSTDTFTAYRRDLERFL